MYDDGSERYFQGEAEFPAGKAWQLERSLGVSEAAQWFPLATGYGSYLAPVYQPMLHEPLDPANSRHGFKARLQPFPLLPVPPRPSSVGLGPRPQYLFVHASLRFRDSDGAVTAVWSNPDDGGASAITAVFNQAELDLSDPTESGAYPFGVGCLTGLSTDSPPLFLSYSIFPVDQNATWPAASGNLSPVNTAIRHFIVNRAPDLRADMWPPINTQPPPPPSPVTLGQRSFYRLRTGELPVDGNGNKIPDAIEAFFNFEPRLMISEACFFRTAATEAELVGGEAADWVEIWNPTSQTLTTEGYFLSDTSGEMEKFALPLRTLGPGEYLIIHCTIEGKARLMAETPPGELNAVTAGFDLKDRGDKLYLNRRQFLNGNWVTTNAHVLDPPPDTVFPTRAIANISFGIRGLPGGTFGYGYFEHPTPGALNQSQILGTGTNSVVACAEPLIEDATSPLGSPLALRGRVFRTGSFSARLRHADPAVSIVYTLNGTEPTGQSAVYDPAHPIVIGGTTILRAKALKANLLPSATVTRTFIHTPSVPSQIRPGTTNTPLHDPIITTPYLTSAPDPLAGYESAGTITDQLEARPSIFLTYPTHEDQGTFTPQWTHTTTGSLVSVEFCDPSNPAAYSQENAYIRISGNHSGTKDSWHLLFKKSANLRGDNRWRTALLDAPGPHAGTSAIFPGSPVRDLNRLVLRSPGFDAYEDVLGSDGNATYLKDAYLKETQRLLGGFTGRRRWVHVHLNGLYWGLYDLEEHHNKETISDHLIAGLSNPSAAQLAAHAPGQVLFLNFDEQGEPADPAAVTSWNAMVAAAAAARQSPADTSLWNTLTNQLDVASYINHIISIGIAGVGSEHRSAQFRGWRHPTTLRWNAIAWDGEEITFEPVPSILTAEDETPQIAEISQDLRPHAYLKFHPEYRAAFHLRLLQVIRQNASSDGPAGILNDLSLLAYFDAGALDFRRTLECEIMRWGYFSSDALSAADLPGQWEKHLVGQIDPETGTQTTEGYRNGGLLRARNTFKLLTREARLLNDIPPPVITVSGNNYNITQPGPTGRIFRFVEFGEKDPMIHEGSPVASPASTSVSGTFQGNQDTITARVYRKDLDGVESWSAKTVFVRP